MVLNKPKSRNFNISVNRYNQRKNYILNWYRKFSLVQIKERQIPYLKDEVDIDYYHLDDNKLVKDQKVQILDDRQMYTFSRATVLTEMDELCYIRNQYGTKNAKWEATDKGNIFIEGAWENSHMVSISFLSIL